MASFKEIARKFLESVKSDTDTYTSQKAEIVQNDSASFSLLTSSHLFYAKNGRGPGKLPPLEAIMEFVKSKNILFDGMSKKSTAFMIQRSIGKNGTKNYKPNGTDPLVDAVMKYQNLFDKQLGDEMAISVNDKVFDELKDIWKEEETYIKEFKV